MTTISQLLSDSSVEIVESSVDLDKEAFNHWQETVEEEKNRAVAGIIQDSQDQLLLVRYVGDETREDGWRLPGSRVGQVTNFPVRLKEELTDQLNIPVTVVQPVRIHKHTGRHQEKEAHLYYVLYDVDVGGKPEEEINQSVANTGIEFQWFSKPPDNVVNPGVPNRILES